MSFLCAGLAVSGCTGSQVVTATPTPPATVTPAPAATVTPSPSSASVVSNPATATPTVAPAAAPAASQAPSQAPPASWPYYEFNWSTRPAPMTNPLLVTECDGIYDWLTNKLFTSEYPSILLSVKLMPGSAPLSTDDVNIELRCNNNTRIPLGLCTQYTGPQHTITDGTAVSVAIRGNLSAIDYRDVRDVVFTCAIGSEHFSTYSTPNWIPAI